MQRYNRQKWRRGWDELNCVKKEKRKFVESALQLELSTMSEISELILLLNKQHQEQMAVFRGEHQEQMAVLRDEHRERNRQHQEQNKQHQEQMAVLRGEHQEQITMLQEQIKILQSSLNNPRENITTPPQMRFVKEGWPHAFSEELKDFKKLENSLSTENGCVFYGLRVIIPSTLRNHILKLLHLGHFGMQRMKQLARSTVYWPRIDFDIENLCRKCTSCGQFQNKPDKPSIHPWMMPEKPWSRLHLDHAINFLGRNWLVLVDAYSKYPCIHPTTSTSSKSTTAILEQEFAHFGYPHTLVTDNATTFMSQEFQAWCKQRGIVHLTGAPYHPATNGAAERLIQSFKQALRKSSLLPKEALQEFLMQYRRIPFASGLSPSELLNGRRIRTKIDTLVPSIPHLLQGRQSRQASKHSNAEDSEVVSKVEHHYSLGDPCYALYFGPRRDRDPRWVPAIVTKVHGTRIVNVRVIPRGPTWRRHLDQLRPRYGSDQDDDPCEIPTSVLSTETLPAGTDHASSSSSMNQRNNPRLPTGDEYGRHNLRRSARTKRPPKKYCC